MESEDFIRLSPSDDSLAGNVNDELDGSNCDSKDVALQPSEGKEDILNSDNLGHENDVQHEVRDFIPEANPEIELVGSDCDMEIEDINNLPFLNGSGSAFEEVKIKYNKEGDSFCIPQANCGNDLVDKSSLLPVSVTQPGTAMVALESNILSSKVHDNGRLLVQDGDPGIDKRGGTTISGVKRARMTVDEQQPSVCVQYDSLARSSKRKLEELLQKWSEWHAQHVSSSQDPVEVVESGEDTFFPALHVGTEKMSAVTFWMENKTRKGENAESTLDSNYVPLYDRGYALGLTLGGGSSNVEGGLEIIDDASRCFNCCSYNHALKECPKPRNHAAVNNARKQLKAKRSQNPNSRNSTRYYQNSPAGKYDGLRPGALDTETRKLLGLGELDPPPWLNRMREIGYPPGYLDPDDDDQPSGIIIYADGEIKDDQEDGEIIERNHREPERIMTVEFPGLNAPIPEKADERLWAAGSSFTDPPRNRAHSRLSYPEPVSRVHIREQRWSRDYRDDGPPGVDPGFAPSSYPPRYGNYDYGYNSPRSPTYGRPLSDRSRRIPLPNEGSFPYSNSRYSPKNHDLDEFRNEYDLDNPAYSRDRQDRHRHHRRR